MTWAEIPYSTEPCVLDVLGSVDTCYYDENANLLKIFPHVRTLLWWKTKASFCPLYSLGGMIYSDTVKPEDDDELSDEEEDMNVTDEEETKEKAAAHDHDECGDHSFLATLMESFLEKVSFLKSREGRAGLVHNFLRGLQLMTAPVPNGEILMF